MEEQTEKKGANWALLILFALAAFGTLELWNHMRGGPFRPWLIDDAELARLTARELTLQEREQEIAQANALDERMMQIAKQQDSEAKRKFK